MQGDWAVVRKSNGDKGLVPSALISEPSNEEQSTTPSTPITPVTPVTPITPVVPSGGGGGFHGSSSSASGRDAMMATLMSTTTTQDGPWKTSTISVIKGDGETFLTLGENEPVTVLDFYAPSWCRVEAHGSIGLVPKNLLNPTFIGINGFPSSSFKNRRPILFLAQAKFDYTGKGKTELSFKAGDVMGIKKEVSGGWYVATLDRRTGHVPAAFFNRLDFLADGVTPATPASVSPKPRQAPQRPQSPKAVPQSPRSVQPPVQQQQSNPEPEKKRLVLRRKSTTSKDLVQQAQAQQQHEPSPPPPDDVNALPPYDQIDGITTATLKAMFDEAEKRHAEEMAAMKALATAQVAEIDKLKQQIIALDARLSKLQTTVEETLSQVEIVEE